MSNEEAQQQDAPAPEQPAHTAEEAAAFRSASSLIIESVTATGIAAGGLGALAAGVAQLKDSFGGSGDLHPQQAEPQQQQQAQPTSTDDG